MKKPIKGQYYQYSSYNGNFNNTFQIQEYCEALEKYIEYLEDMTIKTYLDAKTH